TCAKHMKEQDGAPVRDSAEFLATEVLPRLAINRRVPVLALHLNCSAQRLKEEPAIRAVAEACAERLAPLASLSCCGFAGDKGLFVPELNQWATRFVRNDIPEECRLGVSTISTCAAGLS